MQILKISRIFIFCLLASAIYAHADDPAEMCIEEIEDHISHGDESGFIVIGNQHFLYQCVDHNIGLSILMEIKPATNPNIQLIGKYNCLELQVNNESISLTYQDACQTRWYYPPACETTTREYSINKNTLVLRKENTTTKPICEFCKGKDGCLDAAREEATKLYKQGSAKQAYELLLSAVQHFEEFLIHNSAGIEPWLVSDLMLFSAKAQGDCTLVEDYALSVVQWTEKSQKAFQYNKSLCSKD